MEPLDIETHAPSAGDEMHIGGTVASEEKKPDFEGDASSSTRASSVIDPAGERSAGFDANGGETQMGAGTPITTLYLTFDTPLPQPNIVYTTTADDSPPPQCPDLSEYTNPQKWPRFRKDLMVTLSCIATAATAYTAGSYSPPANLIAAELGTTRIGALCGVTTFCMGFALAPMVLAPFSEVKGRYPVFVLSGMLFTLFQAVCGLVHSLAGMLIARFMTGVGGSVFSTVVGGVIADMFEKEERNTPMALFSGSVLVGTGLGPLCAAVMTQRWGDQGQKWKWIFWHQVIFDSGLMVAIAVLFQESRGCVLLSRRVKKLNTWYEELEANGIYGVWVEDQRSTGSAGVLETTADPEKQAPVSHTRLRRIRWVTKEDEQRGSLASMVTTSLVRPFHLLFTEPIVFFFSLWVSFAWAILYLTFGSIPLVFQRQYNFTLEQSGYVFLAMIVSSIPATAIGLYQQSILQHRAWRRKTEEASSESDSSDNSDVGSSRFWTFVRRKFPAESHESRLYGTCFTSVLLPLGLYLFGFSAQPDVHWIVPTIAIGFASMGIYYIYLATFNYLADIYQSYASSALAAQSFCRNVLGGVFPLVTAALFNNLGEDVAGGLLGAIATVLTVVPWVLVLYGERIRARSSFAVSLEHR